MALGLALSGGGAKGAAHIGVLQALKEENINIEYISGTSSGSIVASLFAAGYSPYEMLDIFNRNCKSVTSYDARFPIKMVSNMINPRTPITGLVDANKLENLLSMYLANKNIVNINQLNLKIAIPAVDLNSGKIIYFLNKEINEKDDIDVEYCYSENLATIVRASSAFPCFFEPRRYKNYLLIDGGIRKNTPVSILKKMGAKKVVAINFSEKMKKPVKDGSIVSLALKCFDIMGDEVSKSELEMADLVINPNVFDVSLLNCTNLTKIANDGYFAVKNNIEKIKEIIK